MNVAVVSSREHLRWFLEGVSEGDISKDCKVLATSPDVLWEAPDSMDIFDHINGVYELGIENFHVVANMCREMDETCRSNGVGSFGTDNFVFAKEIFDAITLKMKMAQNFIDKYAPKTISMFRNHSATVWENSYTIAFGEVCSKNDILFDDIVIATGGHTKRSIRLPSSLYNIGMAYRYCGISGAASAIKAELTAKKILYVSKYGYDWENILPHLYKRGFRAIRIPESYKAGPIPSSPVELLMLRPIFGRYCNFDGMSFDDEFGEAFSSIANEYRLMYRIRQEVKKTKPVAMLCAINIMPTGRITADACRVHGIPIISYQHGDMGIKRSPIAHYIEYLGSDIHLVFGDGVRKEFEEDPLRPSQSQCRIESVGSKRLLDLSNIGCTNKYDVIYTTTNYVGYTLNVSTSPLSNDSNLWRTQKAIIDTLRDMNCSVLLSLHPSWVPYEHITEYASDADNITVIRGKPLSDTISQSETVIHDFPSTTLLQSISAGRRVFLYNGLLQLVPDAISSLKKRIFMSDDLDDFTGLLRDKLLNKCLTMQDPEFSSLYCINGGEDIVERVIDIIEKEQKVYI